MKSIGAGLLFAAALLTSSSCARPDWIERTLVTVDVTGTWFGLAELSGGTGRASLWLDLQQEGPKVTGSVRLEGGAARPIEGSVAGDTFSFHASSGTALVKGELTVSGDDMTGEVLTQGAFLTRVLRLQRVGPATRPDSARPKE